jgi:RNA polymerase sigma-70 factor (ECF subfamily)
MTADPTSIVARARERWPGLSACDEPAPANPVLDDSACDAIDRGAELYLAHACAAGDCVAIRAFEAEFFPEVRACHARIRPPSLGVDELEQRIREKLFAHKAVSRFSGKGDLRRWLRVLTTRLIFDHVRSIRPAVPLEDQLLPDAVASTAEATRPNAALRAEIRGALREAFAAMTDRQKLLVQAEVRGTPLSALAETYQVNVRSIQRWVRDAHDALLAGFRGALGCRLRIAPGELSSVIAFARSQLLSALGDLRRESDASTSPAPGEPCPVAAVRAMTGTAS